MIGISKDKTYINYLLFLDEKFFYPIVDQIVVNNNNSSSPNYRKIGNRYNLKLIKGITINVRFFYFFKILILNYYK